MRFFPNNQNPDAYYEPNSFGGPVERPDVAEPPLKISGDAERYNHRVGNDDFSQPRALFTLFDAGQKQRLFANIAAAMAGSRTPSPPPVGAVRKGAPRLWRRCACGFAGAVVVAARRGTEVGLVA
jgi:hypothetical protein